MVSRGRTGKENVCAYKGVPYIISVFAYNPFHYFQLFSAHITVSVCGNQVICERHCLHNAAITTKAAITARDEIISNQSGSRVQD